jgi:hypothetical protein
MGIVEPQQKAVSSPRLRLPTPRKMIRHVVSMPQQHVKHYTEDKARKEEDNDHVNSEIKLHWLQILHFLILSLPENV